MPRPILCSLLALLTGVAGTATTDAADAATPPLVSYPAAVTGITNVRALTEAAGKVWLAGDAVAFDSTLVSCIDESTGQKCGPTYPTVLRDAGGVDQTTPKGIAVAGDGAVWVANLGDKDNSDGTNGSVSRILPSTGASTTFTGGVYAPHAIVVGADGDLWVANDSNTISHLDPADGAPRVGSPFASGATSGSSSTLFPFALAVGRDGDVWATLSDGNSAVRSRITRLDGTTGAVDPGYPKPTGGDHSPGPLTIGADGDVWVSDGSSGQVSRLAPDTGTNRAGYPRFKTSATGMATGLDGDIWLTGGNPATVDRLDPTTGSSRDGYPFAMPTTTDAITIAANGDPWVAVTQTNADRVVHVNLSGSTVAPPAGGGTGGGSGTSGGGGTGGGGGGTATTGIPPVTAATLPPVATTTIPSRPPAPRDVTPPEAKLTGATKQRARTSISVTVGCPTEACTATATATLAVPRTHGTKTYRLAKATHPIAAGKHVALKLGLTKAVRAAAARALRGRTTRAGVKATVTVAVTDAAGNTRSVRRTIRLTA